MPTVMTSRRRTRSSISPQSYRARLGFFVAEYDFSKYFDSISHEYLRLVLRNGQFLLTKVEMTVIESFLRILPLPESKSV
jgi:hypothetical protein